MRSKMNGFHYQLAQAGGFSIDFVAFGRNRCCKWPHRNRPKARGGRALATHMLMIPIFGNANLTVELIH